MATAQDQRFSRSKLESSLVTLEMLWMCWVMLSEDAWSFCSNRRTRASQLMTNRMTNDPPASSTVRSLSPILIAPHKPKATTKLTHAALVNERTVATIRKAVPAIHNMRMKSDWFCLQIMAKAGGRSMAKTAP